jgi:hypothetical protein
VLVNEGESVANNEDALVALLTSIDRRLALLTVREERDLRRALDAEVLKADSRIAMFNGIDGVRGSGELGKLGGVGERSAQLFIKELLGLGLVLEVPNGARAVIVEKDHGGILNWYLSRSDGA